MSNFFRDNALTFKPRSNIFSKLRVSNSKDNSLSSGALRVIRSDDNSMNKAEDSGSSLMENVFLHSSNSGKHTSSTTLFDDATGGDHKPNHINESTPKALKNYCIKGPNNGGIHDEEDELEITEVRELTQDDTSFDMELADQKASTLTESIKPPQQHSDTSSNDVLLEAFTNTQKICSNLKIELQKQQNKNQAQKKDILTYQSEIAKINEKLLSYKKFLGKIEEKSRWLLQQKKSDDTKIHDLKVNYDGILEKLKEYLKESMELKVTIEQLRDLKQSTDAEISKKDKELEYLKRELNNCSGQLSEEKIKNSDMLQELNNTREESMTRIELLFSTQESKIREGFESLIKGYSSILKTDTPALVETEIMKLSAVFKETSKTYLEKSTESLAQIIDTHEKNVLNSGKEINLHSDHKLEKVAKEIILIKDQQLGLKSAIENLQKVTTSSIEENVQTHSEASINLMEKLETSVSTISKELIQYKSELDQNKEYESKINDFQRQVHSIGLQKSEVVALMKTKDAEIEDLNNQLFNKTKLTEEFEATTEALKDEIKSLKENARSKDQLLNNVQNELKAIKNNFDSKFSAQNEIVKMVTQERDELKKKLNRETDSKHRVEKEGRVYVDKFQRVNEQLQKLNVEIVQLKARELELDEENRKLRNETEQFDQAFRANDDEFQEVKEKLISLESEKQRFITDRLECQDKIEELELQLKEATKNIQHLRDQAHKRPSKKPPPVETSVKSPASKTGNYDEFHLSSSLNDDLELTNPSPIQIKPLRAKRGSSVVRTSMANKKKLLLSDDDDITNKSRVKNTRKKRRI